MHLFFLHAWFSATWSAFVTYPNIHEKQDWTCRWETRKVGSTNQEGASMKSPTLELLIEEMRIVKHEFDANPDMTAVTYLMARANVIEFVTESNIGDELFAYQLLVTAIYGKDLPPENVVSYTKDIMDGRRCMICHKLYVHPHTNDTISAHMTLISDPCIVRRQ